MIHLLIDSDSSIVFQDKGQKFSFLCNIYCDNLCEDDCPPF